MRSAVFKHVHRFPARLREPKAALALLGAALFLMAVAAVFATSEERTIHIFPTSVSDAGWSGAQRSLEQTLSQNAIFDDFSAENSASLYFTRNASRSSEGAPHEAVSAGDSTSGGDAVSSEDASNDTEASEVQGDQSAESGDLLDDAADAEGQVQEETPAPEQEEEATQEDTPTPQVSEEPEPLADLSPYGYVRDLLRAARGTAA